MGRVGGPFSCVTEERSGFQIARRFFAGLCCLFCFLVEKRFFLHFFFRTAFFAHSCLRTNNRRMALRPPPDRGDRRATQISGDGNHVGISGAKSIWIRKDCECKIVGLLPVRLPSSRTRPQAFRFNDTALSLLLRLLLSAADRRVLRGSFTHSNEITNFLAPPALPSPLCRELECEQS